MKKKNIKSYQKKLLIFVGGASGNYLALKLANVLKKRFCVHLIVSKGAKMVLKYELGIKFKTILNEGLSNVVDTDFLDYVKVFKDKDLAACISSGSYLNRVEFYGAFFYSSADFLANICISKCDTLGIRAFFVCEKQKVDIVISPRENPLSKQYLKNLLKLSKRGHIIAPPMFGAYHFDGFSSKTIEIYEKSQKNLQENFIIGKWCDALKIKNDFYKKWRENEA